MTYHRKHAGRTASYDRDGFLKFLAKRFRLESVEANILLTVAESDGKKELVIPSERGSDKARLEKALKGVTKALEISRELATEKSSQALIVAKREARKSEVFTQVKEQLTDQAHPFVESSLGWLRNTAGEVLDVTDTGAQLHGSPTMQSLMQVIGKFCVADDGIRKTSNLFNWVIGDACNIAVEMGYYRSSLLPDLSKATGLHISHLKKMAHFSKVIPEHLRIPGWPQARYQAIIPYVSKLTPQKLKEALVLICNGGHVLNTLRFLSGEKIKRLAKAEPRYLAVTPWGIFHSGHFLRKIALNRRCRLIDLRSMCVLDAAQEVLYKIPPASESSADDPLLGLLGVSFDGGVEEDAS